MRILLVEDDIAIARAVKRGLELAHYIVEVKNDGDSGLNEALSSPYSLIILDIMLPKKSGWEICERLREMNMQTPILMLTARVTLDDKVKGFGMGADDYLTKPFEFPELLARAQALLRRDKFHKTKVINIADLEIDTGRRIVHRAGKVIGLSHREYDLLEALASQEGRVLTREVIQERVWMDYESLSNTVDVYIGLLRKKIDSDNPIKLIHTIRGVGYTLKRMESVNEI